MKSAAVRRLESIPAPEQTTFHPPLWAEVAPCQRDDHKVFWLLFLSLNCRYCCRSTQAYKVPFNKRFVKYYGTLASISCRSCCRSQPPVKENHGWISAIR